MSPNALLIALKLLSLATRAQAEGVTDEIQKEVENLRAALAPMLPDKPTNTTWEAHIAEQIARLEAIEKMIEQRHKPAGE